MDSKTLKVLMLEIPQFDKLDNSEVDILANHIEYREASAGTTLLEEGTSGYSLFYIVKGVIEIKKEALSGRQTVLARFAKGSTVGEMSLIEDHSKHSATATVIEDSELLILSQKSFNNIKDSFPKIAIKILQNIAVSISSRLRHTSGRFADIFQ